MSLDFILSKGNIRVTPRELRSVESSNPLSQDILDILASDIYKEYFKFFEQTVVPLLITLKLWYL